MLIFLFIYVIQTAYIMYLISDLNTLNRMKDDYLNGRINHGDDSNGHPEIHVNNKYDKSDHNYKHNYHNDNIKQPIEITSRYDKSERI